MTDAEKILALGRALASHVSLINALTIADSEHAAQVEALETKITELEDEIERMRMERQAEDVATQDVVRETLEDYDRRRRFEAELVVAGSGLIPTDLKERWITEMMGDASAESSRCRPEG